MIRAALWFGGAAVLLNPLYFVLYRLSIFNTVPRDDYAFYLLWLLGRPEGGFPDAPYAYRPLSMLAAAAFFHLPRIPLTNTPTGLSEPYLRATAAITMLAFLAWIAACLLAHAAALRAGLARRDAALAGVLAGILMLYTQITAIDPLAVALIAAGVLLSDRRWPFAALLVGSIFCNEKVALVLALWLVIRCALSPAARAQFGWQAAACIISVLIYIGTVRTMRLPGNPYQVDPGYFLATIGDNLRAYATARGFLANVLPILILSALAWIGRPVGPFRRTDILLIPALAVVALLLTQLFQAGRIVMHAAPIFVVPAAAALSRWLGPEPAT